MSKARQIIAEMDDVKDWLMRHPRGELYLVQYHHRHVTDAWVFVAPEEPTPEQVAHYFDLNFEPEFESLEIRQVGLEHVLRWPTEEEIAAAKAEAAAADENFE